MRFRTGPKDTLEVLTDLGIRSSLHLTVTGLQSSSVEGSQSTSRVVGLSGSGWLLGRRSDSAVERTPDNLKYLGCEARSRLTAPRNSARQSQACEMKKLGGFGLLGHKELWSGNPLRVMTKRRSPQIKDGTVDY